MATTLNPEALAGIQIGTSVGSVAEWLRSITVRISGAGRSRGTGVIWRSNGINSSIVGGLGCAIRSDCVDAFLRGGMMEVS